MKSNRLRLSQQSEYDLWVATEFSQIREQVDHYFIDHDTTCPYGMPYKAVFHQALFSPVHHQIMELFLASGYRRNGDCLYSMACPNCSACVSIRLFPENFVASRSQKRNWKKNSGIETVMRPLKDIPLENIDLCEKFLKDRYPTDNSGERYYREFFANRITDTYEIDFLCDGKLLGTSIIDLGENYANAVYFYFDPAESHRGLGTYNILYLIEMCKSQGIGILYLGYFIEECRAMNYKKKYRPHQLLINDRWTKGD